MSTVSICVFQNLGTPHPLAPKITPETLLIFNCYNLTTFFCSEWLTEWTAYMAWLNGIDTPHTHSCELPTNVLAIHQNNSIIPWT